MAHWTQDRSTRRVFLRTTATAAAAAVGAVATLPNAGCSSTARTAARSGSRGLIDDGDVILFQGDSITDAGRSRRREDIANDTRALGNGYAFLAASQLLADRPEAGLKIYNRGISGNKVFQLAERWDADCLSLKPDVLSILVGVNDIWHTLDGRYNGTVEIYERDYRALLERTRQALPHVKLVICEPFVLHYGAVNEKWFPEFDGYRSAARRVATDFDAVFVAFQTMFDEAAATTPPVHWAADGVHPTVAGAQLMALIWLKAVKAART